MENLQYPIGKFSMESGVRGEPSQLIESISGIPRRLRETVEGMSNDQLDTPYRPGGWTVRQVIHHIPDSHFNAYARFKLAVTEEEPTVKVYDEKAWSELEDARTGPIEISLTLLDALHKRWVLFLRSLPPSGFERTLNHPELGQLNLNQLLGSYEWHGRHHLAHITSLKERMNWS